MVKVMARGLVGLAFAFIFLLETCYGVICQFCQPPRCSDAKREALSFDCPSGKCSRVEDYYPNGTSAVILDCLHSDSEPAGCVLTADAAVSRVSCVCVGDYCNEVSVAEAAANAGGNNGDGDDGKYEKEAYGLFGPFGLRLAFCFMQCI